MLAATDPWQKTGLWVLTLCAILPFAQTRNFGHVHDDHDLRGEGSLVAQPTTDLQELWTADLFAAPNGTAGGSGFWRPLLLLTSKAEHWITNGEKSPLAWVGHSVNLLIHAFATLGFFAWLCALGYPFLLSWAAAVLFAVHPVHVEAVTWISCRMDVAAAGCVFWAGATLRPEKNQPFLTTVLVLAALLWKESALFALPLICLLAVASGAAWKAALKGPALGLLAYGLLRLFSFDRVVSEDAFLGPESLVDRMYTWLSVLPEVITLSIWPMATQPFRGISSASSLLSPGVLAGGAVLLAGLIAFIAFWRRRQLTGLFVTGTLLLPCILLAPWVQIPIGYKEIAIPLYERHLYLSAGGGCLLGALLLLRLCGRHAYRLPLLALLVAVFVGGITASRAQVWSDDVSLARAGIEAIPQSGDLWNHLGYGHLRRIGHPDYPEALEKALVAFETALRRAPGHRLAALNHFGALRMGGMHAEAMEAAGLLLRSRPSDPAVLDAVASWHVDRGRWAIARDLFRAELATGEALPGVEEAIAICEEMLRGAEGGT